MKKGIVFLTATAAMLLVGCKKDDPSQPQRTTIVGTWSLQQENGSDVLTNNRTIVTYALGGNKRFSLSKYVEELEMWTWKNKAYGTYNLGNNGDFQETVDKILYSGSASMTSNNALTVHLTKSKDTKKGTEKPINIKYNYTRVSDDLYYEDAIIGLWEGVEMTGEETYGDINHRWEYKQSIGGITKYDYLSKNGQGEWEANPTNNGQYNVHGNWLATTWTNDQGNPEYEWWDIELIDDTYMKWSAWRKNEQGKRYKTTFTLRRVKE